MCKALRYQELFVILFRKDHPVILPECPAALTNVNGNIIDSPANYTDQLRLRVMDLEVQAPQYACRAAALVVLNENVIQSSFGHVAVIVCLGEIAPFVPVNRGRNHTKSLNPSYIILNVNLSHSQRDTSSMRLSSQAKAQTLPHVTCLCPNANYTASLLSTFHIQKLKQE